MWGTLYASDHLAWAWYLGAGTFMLDSMVRPVALWSTYLFELPNHGPRAWSPCLTPARWQLGHSTFPVDTTPICFLFRLNGDWSEEFWGLQCAMRSLLLQPHCAHPRIYIIKSMPEISSSGPTRKTASSSTIRECNHEYCKRNTVTGTFMMNIPDLVVDFRLLDGLGPCYPGFRGDCQVGCRAYTHSIFDFGTKKYKRS